MYGMLFQASFFLWCLVKNLPAMKETWVQSLGQKNSLEKGTATPLQYSCLENSMDRGAWQATQSMGSQRVGHK